MMNLWYAPLGYYGIALLSALVPWVNAEILMLSAVPLAGSPIRLGVIVIAVTAGQMTGKAAMYWISRRTTGGRAPRLQNAIDHWRRRLEGRPWAILGIILISAAAGVPPFYLVSIVAGALGIAFGRFLAVGTLGRLIHFGVVAFVPQLIWSSL